MVCSNSLRFLLFDRIFDIIHDGIIIMKNTREIIEINPAAKKMTGWEIGEYVPYCTHCKNRPVTANEERCQLVSKKEVPYFLSEMPTYISGNIPVEMSTALIFSDEEKGEQLYLLVLRDQSIKRKVEEARISKQMIKKLIQAKEDEHQRLSKELHDGVGQSLYSISIGLKHIEKKVGNEELKRYTSELREDISNLLFDVKNYSYYLRPKSLDEMGLCPTIAYLIERLQNQVPSITFSFMYNEEQPLDSNVEINLYRVVQEALMNALKYSEGTEMKITLQYGKDGVSLVVSDNGVGIDNEKKGDGLGLKHMEERLAMVGGVLQIESKKSIGTVIKGFVPLSESEINENKYPYC